MSTTTSLTGTISVDLTADTLTLPQNIVVREDIYQGATLLGTTYRNITFTSSYVTPIPAITFNGIETTFTTAAAASAAVTSFVSPTNVTTLTFTNTTLPSSNWNNSVLTCTITP